LALFGFRATLVRGNKKNSRAILAMSIHSRHGSDLVMDPLDAANGIENLSPATIRELLRAAATVLCELTHTACPTEARKAGCSRLGSEVVCSSPSADF
jgi:hypothetical protein